MSETVAEIADPQIDNSFTGLLAQAREAGMAFAAERDRLREVIQTLYVNALRTTTPDKLIEFMASQLGEIAAGKALNDAIRDHAAHLTKETTHDHG